MWRTLVGYAGGTTSHPTYRSIGDHAESLRVEYDPKVIGYDTLLDHFLAEVDPFSRAFSRQYASIIFFHGTEQEGLARERLAKVAKGGDRPVWVELLPAGAFTPAEDYHQKYYLRQTQELIREFQAMYPDPAELARSSAAMRANAALGGHLAAAVFARESPRYGLSEAGQRLLSRYARRIF